MRGGSCGEILEEDDEVFLLLRYMGRRRRRRRRSSLDSEFGTWQESFAFAVPLNAFVDFVLGLLHRLQ